MTRLLRAGAALAALLTTPLLAQGIYIGPEEPPPRPIQPPIADPQPIPPPHRVPDRRHGPAVELGLLQVRATIEDGAAATEVEQTFHNLTGTIQEGTWIMPLPPGAVADRFTMTVNGVEQKGEVLDANRARQIYTDIVRRQRDPGLLEYLDHGCLRARIFPIPANGQMIVKVRWVQVLPQSGTFREWRYPVRAAFLGGHGPKKLTVTAEIRSRSPIKSIYSPTAGVDITRDGEHRARVSLGIEGGQVPASDLQVLYGVSEQDFGCHVLSHRAPGQDGYFLMMLSPKHEWPEQHSIRRAITFVLDTSGSMAGEKIEQARSAVRTFLASLRPEDFFNVIPFSNEARPFFTSPLPASRENIDQALARVGAIEARSGTNIEDAMGSALGQALPEIAGLVPITVFLTDGLPTVGTTDVNTLLARVDQQNHQKSRVFVFGVGHDVNTRLLDTIAERTRGDRDYVQPGENIEVKAGALFQKVAGPVLTDVEIICAGIEGFDILPRRTPDMFVGSTLVLVGRYRGQGEPKVTLRGKVGATVREYVFPAVFPDKAPGHDWLPALWAQKKVAFLLDQIRLNGANPELVAEVTRLGKEHGIVTPYTSHLIVEEGQRLALFRGITVTSDSDAFFLGTGTANVDRLRRELQRAGRPAGPGTPGPGVAGLATATQAEAEGSKQGFDDKSEVGRAAVQKSAAYKELRDFAQVATVLPNSAIAMTHQRIGQKQFHLLEGVWVDRGYQAAMKDKTRKVTAFSDDYFALLTERPHLARYLAFSTRITVVDGDEVIEIE